MNFETQPRPIGVQARWSAFAIACLLATMSLMIALSVLPGKAFAAMKYVDIRADTTWRSQDWRGDPAQEPEHNDGIVITLYDDATVTVTGQQYFFGNVTIQGKGTIKRANGFDSDTTFFTLGDPHSYATSGYDINLTIAGDVVIDGNARENGMGNRALLNMTATDKTSSSLAPKDGTDITFTMKDNAKVTDMYVNYESPGAGIWATAGDKSSVTINMQDNATFEGMNGLAVRANDNHGNGPIALNMSGNASIQGSYLGAVTGLNSLVMTDNAEITGTGGDYAVKVDRGTVELTGDAKVEGNTGGGLKVNGNTSTVAIGGNASVSGNTLETNASSSAGAGIYLLGSTKATISGSALVSNNVATGDGGGVYATSKSVVQIRENAKVNGNSAANGGGVALAGNATMTISGTAEIAGNGASRNGGGIYAPESASGAVVHVNGGKVSGNVAEGGNGGGVLVERAGALDLAGGTVDGNEAAALGSGIYAPHSFYIQGNPQVFGNADAAMKGDVFLERDAVMQLVSNRTLSSPLSSIGVLVREGRADDHVVESPSGTVFTDGDAARFFYDTDEWFVVTNPAQSKPTSLVLGTDKPQVIDIANATIDAIPDQVYTGEAISPSVTVTYGGRTLAKGTDYYLEFQSNVEVGQATVVVTGTGEFAGTKQAHFNIVPKEEAPKWLRLAGDTRYSTAARIVEEGFGNDSCETVVVASGEGFADALAACSLAGACKAPVVLTKGDALSPEARVQIARVGARQAYMIGGTKALARQVKADLEDMGLSVQRISGETRQETSAMVARWTDRFARMQTIVVACGKKFPDALSIGSYSYATKSPIVLTDNAGKLAASELMLIKSFGVKDVVIVGGTGSVSASVESQLGPSFNIVRLAGSTRYDTSAEIARWLLGETAGDAQAPAFQPKTTLNCTNPGVATGEKFPDALAGACLCGSKGSVLVLTNGKEPTVSTGISTVLSPRVDEIETGYVFGGESAIRQDLMDGLPGAEDKAQAFAVAGMSAVLDR